MVVGPTSGGSYVVAEANFGELCKKKDTLGGVMGKKSISGGVMMLVPHFGRSYVFLNPLWGELCLMNQVFSTVMFLGYTNRGSYVFDIL